MKLKMRVVTWSVGLFLAASFVLCVLYGLVVPERTHGIRVFLEAVLPAFTWLNFGAFILGLAESFLYGVYFGIVFVPIHNFILKVDARRRSVKGFGAPGPKSAI